MVKYPLVWENRAKVLDGCSTCTVTVPVAGVPGSASARVTRWEEAAGRPPRRDLTVENPPTTWVAPPRVCPASSRIRLSRFAEEGWSLTDAYGVLFDIDVLTAFTDAVVDTVTDGRAPRVLFVITDSPTEFSQAVERLPVGIETVQLYEDYLSNYTINTAGGSR